MNCRIAGIIKNDFAAAPGVCLTIFTQGCKFHCPGCHNPEQWDFEGGKKYDFEIQREILEGINANGIMRNLCIMGGEPLVEENAEFTKYLMQMVKVDYPDIKVYVWSGYTYEQLLERAKNGDENIEYVLSTADFLIDGLYKEEERDVTLPMRGSRNQRVIDLHTGTILDI